MNFARYSKLIPAIIGAATEALALGLIPAPADHYVTVGIAFLTALAVYVVPPNKPVDAPPDA